MLEDVDLHVDPGDVVAIGGSNGAGKTTLLRIVATVVTPDRGEGSVAGADLLRQAARVREHTGVSLANDRAMYWRLDGFGNLEFFARLRGRSRRDSVRAAGWMIDRLDLGRVATRRVGTWSAGERQRLSIGRALLCDPAVALLDEPSRSLDEDGRRRVDNLIRRAAVRGTAVLMANPAGVVQGGLVHRVLRLERGRLLPVASGAAEGDHRIDGLPGVRGVEVPG